MFSKLCIPWVFAASLAAAQAPGTTTQAKLAFDVISIRQNTTHFSMANRPAPPGATADGYRMVGGPLLLPIVTAWVPHTGATAFMSNQIKGLPEWAMQESYDIDARVSNEDLAEWRNPASQKAMLAAMMQSLLEDRCKMVVHRETKDEAVSLLVVGKNGPKLKVTDPEAEHPDGMKLPFGGVMVVSSTGMTLYGTSMASLATLLSGIGGQGVGRPIHDKTGLTGTYDIAMRPPQFQGPPTPGEQPNAPSDPGAIFSSMIYSTVEALGLKLESGKEPVETLVIDHMERPSQN